MDRLDKKSRRYCGFSIPLCALLLCLACLAPGLRAGSGNSYPIVLVHGFSGWGPDEIEGYQYWGGRDSIEATLVQAGHPTYTGVVGPVSSNWDRACELYAYIKGGRVDYGTAHAKRYGHLRFGRTFAGLIPDWGEPGAHARVHLVGHSQGGQTIRVLTSLLARGDAAERNATDTGAPHPLFRGQKPWVHSVTSINTPHDGTTLAILLADEADFLMSSILELTAYLNARTPDATSYDFKLDQWGISQRDGETDKEYRKRLRHSELWDQQDISIWDLQPAGAAALNRRYPALESVYYFSWASNDSYPGLLGDGTVPRPGTNPALILPAFYIGSFEDPDPGYGLPPFEDSWWPNDGIVNTRSMTAPQLGRADPWVSWAERNSRPIETGIWNFMGTREGWDHLDVVGLQTRKDFMGFYHRLAQQLAALPAPPP